MLTETFWMSDLELGFGSMRERWERMDCLEVEKDERKDWVDSKEGGGGGSVEVVVEMRDCWRLVRREIIASRFFRVVGSKVWSGAAGLLVGGFGTEGSESADILLQWLRFGWIWYLSVVNCNASEMKLND